MKLKKGVTQSVFVVKDERVMQDIECLHAVDTDYAVAPYKEGGRTTWRECELWSVIHVPSGMAICACLTDEAYAKLLIAEIVKSGVSIPSTVGAIFGREKEIKAKITKAKASADRQWQALQENKSIEQLTLW